MAFLTGLALRRRSVTIMVILLVLVSGIYTYRTLSVELFPEIEFPLVTVMAFYPSANPDAVVRDVTGPIERAISGIDGLENVQTVSSENRSLALATFVFGTDMADAESVIRSNLGSIQFPTGVDRPIIGRVNQDAFPVLQLSLIGDFDMIGLQRVLESRILPTIRDVDGVFSVEVTGTTEERVLVTVDSQALSQNGLSLFQVSQALRENNVTFPAGSITDQGLTFPVKTTHTFTSVEELRDLVVGFPVRLETQDGTKPPTPPAAIRLDDVADVTLGSGLATSISRTNGKPSLGLGVLKEPDANTIDVTTSVLDALNALDGLPSDVEIVTITNDGPEIQAQIDTLEREALFGFMFAVAVVFAFMLTNRPTMLRGLVNTLRPTAVIGLSIPLSVLAGVLLLSWQGLTLNFMTLGGLAISVGRVVDDSIVVLENVYRHIQGGRERWRAALQATVEVGPAITASTLTTIVVFVPLAFIKGLVGSFFLPFALAVSFALVGSLLVALTAVPVLGAYLLRPGDLPEGAGDDDDLAEQENWMQRFYTPQLKWVLRHKAIALTAALVATIASLGLIAFIPVTLFPSGGDRFLSVELALPPGTSPDRTIAEVEKIENDIQGVAETYISTIGSPSAAFGSVGPSGFNQASVLVRLREDAPDNVADTLRNDLGGVQGRVVNIIELNTGGPPTQGVEISITGDSYADIVMVAGRLVDKLSDVGGIVNIASDVAEARDEIAINVDPEKAVTLGVSAHLVALQVNQFLVGQSVTQMDVDGRQIDVFLGGSRQEVDSIDKIKSFMITGPMGAAPLSDIAEIATQPGPVTISRTGGQRSANITGSITDDDAQAVGMEVQNRIDELDLPPGVEVSSGGIFRQIEEGFQDIFLAMAVGVVLVYLVMVASLGSLRNPVVIITSLPLALIGVFASLAITGRTLGLPALMGVLLLIGIVVTNAIVLIAFVEQLREKGMSVQEALVNGARVRLRPILMTALTTSFALLPLAVFVGEEGGIIGAELATVVIGGLATSTFLTLMVVPIVYALANESIPRLLNRIEARLFGRRSSVPAPTSDQTS